LSLEWLWVSREVSGPILAKTEAAEPRGSREIRQSMKEGSGPVKPSRGFAVAARLVYSSAPWHSR